MLLAEDALRKEMKLVPEITIRERVANGEPVVPVERFIDGYQSRNKRLAGLMRRMGICEEKSSGIDRVVQAAELFQLLGPALAGSV